MLDNIEPARRSELAPDRMTEADDEAWRQVIADEFSRTWQQAASAPDEPPAAQSAAVPAEVEQWNHSAGSEQDGTGWGRSVQPPAEDWGWPESPSAQPSGYGRGDAGDAPDSSGGRSNDSNGASSGWSGYTGQAGWAGAPPQGADESDGSLPDITLFTREERVRRFSCSSTCRDPSCHVASCSAHLW